MDQKTLSGHIRSIKAAFGKMSELGYRTDLLLQGTGIMLNDINSPDPDITIQQELAFIRNILSVSGDPLIGLLIGEAFPPQIYGNVGFAALSAKTLGQALEISASYGELTYSRFKLTCTTNNDCTRFNMFNKNTFEKEIHDFYIDRDLSAAKKAFNDLLGSEVALKKVSLGHDNFHLRTRYESYFDCPVEFGSDSSWLEIDQKTANSPLPQHNSETTKFCQQQCKKLIQELTNQSYFIDTVRNAIIAKPGIFPTIDDIAKKMNMSTSTLRRRLNEEGSNYQSILNEIRYNLAREYLSFSNMSLEKISNLLGYSDPGNFTHAFKKWSGKSPRSWRKSRTE